MRRSIPRAGSEPWRIQWPRVPREIRSDFARASLSAATLWAAAALYLSIVPSYAGALLHTRNLALLGAIAALALASSCFAQALVQRSRLDPRLGSTSGLVLLALGLTALAAAFPTHSLAVLLCGSVAVGLGHGSGIVGTQHELNTIAPPQRRGEVTAAFIGCIYSMVGAAVIASGLLALHFALSAAVGAVAVALALTALVTAGWQGAHLIKSARS